MPLSRHCTCGLSSAGMTNLIKANKYYCPAMIAACPGLCCFLACIENGRERPGYEANVRVHCTGLWNLATGKEHCMHCCINGECTLVCHSV